MRTDKQINASKTNGAKSKGPITAEGKANSARNGARHNLSGGHIVLLSNEDPYEFHSHATAYIARFQPIDGVELDLVHRMIAASWREKRISAMETSLFELEMDRQRHDVEQQFEHGDIHVRLTLALVGATGESPAAMLLQRYGSTARREYASAYRILRDLQGERFNRPPSLAPDLPASTVQPPDAHAEAANETPGGASPTPKAYAPGLVLFSRRSPQIAELRSEPGIAIAAGQSGQMQFAPQQHSAGNPELLEPSE